MGSIESKPSPADLDIYICGIISRSTNYKMLKNIIFSNYNQSLNHKIKLKKRNESYYLNREYRYEYRFLQKTIKNIENEEKIIKYNSYIFPNVDVDEYFSKVLSFYLYEYDVHNKRKNVVISFSNQTIIKNAFDELNEFSSETQPILILIDDNQEYSDKLDYLNYIPGLTKIKRELREKIEENVTEGQINQMAEKLFITYLNTKLFRICAYYNEMGYNLNMINPLNEINSNIKFHATIALVGESGCGKSTLLNFIFNELVARVNTSSEDVTTKCSEYYLPVKINKNIKNIGQLRFLDFPGLKNENNYEYVENVIKIK